MAKAPLPWRPMLASLAEASLTDPQLLYEPKYDGIRAIVDVAPGGPARVWSRAGNEKTTQFPEIVRALEQWSTLLEAPVILDGEIVALVATGEPAGFQHLQGRIHRSAVDENAAGAHVAFIAFDILRDGSTDLRDRPLLERRTILERIFAAATSTSILRISEIARGDGRQLYDQALARGWEGLIAKGMNSRYQSGKRTPDWRKLKILHEQEFVVAGWTEPRRTRSHFGALLLGVYEPGNQSHPKQPRRADHPHRQPEGHRLLYVGHTGTGFNEAELARLMTLLKPLETTACPFSEPPATNERPHWVRPALVAQIRFTEWTAEGSLRHPVYLGLRDDKRADEVVRETETRLDATTTRRTATSKLQVPGSGFRVPGSGLQVSDSQKRGSKRGEPGTPNAEPRTTNLERGTRNLELRALIAQLQEIEDSRRDGVLVLPGGDRLSVGNLHKVFWPKQKLTKGDLFRYYAAVAPFILPAVADRPLVMKRFPNGIAGKPFYQHRAPEAPAGVRVDTPKVPDGIPQFIGGALATLLYTTQLAAISQDPWLSRLQSVPFADHVALDLDPSDGVPFGRVLDVARWIRDELDALGTVAAPKTSGVDGLHIYIPLPPETSYEAGQLFCQIIATVVAQKHPKVATVERQVRARGARVYVDYLQNILGKTLATAYSARASGYAGVSTPLAWQEVEDGVRREDFTIETIPARLEAVGDLWATLREAKGVDLSRAFRYADLAGRTGSKKT